MTLNALDIFRFSFGLLNRVLAVAGACVGAVLVISFRDRAVIILAGLVGSMLTMRGPGMLLPWLGGWGMGKPGFPIPLPRGRSCAGYLRRAANCLRNFATFGATTNWQ